MSVQWQASHALSYVVFFKAILFPTVMIQQHKNKIQKKIFLDALAYLPWYLDVQIQTWRYKWNIVRPASSSELEAIAVADANAYADADVRTSTFKWWIGLIICSHISVQFNLIIVDSLSSDLNGYNPR